MITKQTLTLIFLALATLGSAQTTADFENFTMDPDTFMNGSDGSGGFLSGNVFLPNIYNDSFQSYTGWAISNTTDVTDPGFMNQYSAITGMGVESSANYAVSFGSTNVMKFENMAAGEVINGFYITNGTYPYFIIRDGNMFSKKFGGLTGNDPDYFLLTIKKYLNGELSTDSIDFYLADYRFSDNTMDYIVDEWTYLDLTPLGAADSLSFALTSTDNDPVFGMNTPAYFYVDNVVTSDGPTSVYNTSGEKSFEVFPNPAGDFIVLKSEVSQATNFTVYDLLGRPVYTTLLRDSQHQIDISRLAKGTYLLKFESEQIKESQLLIKQ